MTSFYESNQKRKAHFIPLCAASKISVRKCAKILRMHYVSVQNLKKRYIEIGEAAFINGHKDRHYQSQKYSDIFRAEIIRLYNEEWKDAPFSTFCEALEKYHHITVKYNSLRKILLSAGIKPPRSWSTKEKEEHRPRTEREREGELVQMDASTHDWFMDGNYESIHGGVDDATHQITGLYMCLNECRLGYNEVLRQTWQDFGVPESYYIDRHSSFVRSRRKKHFTINERIDYAKNESTHFVDLCNELDIEVILALSAQGKGRIERLWQTLQGKLPFIFRFLGIKTIDAANTFLREWVKEFNQKYKRKAACETKAWRPLKEGYDLDYKLSVKFSCRTNWEGVFKFHECEFRLGASLRAYKDFELCLSEQFGIRAFMHGKWYPVELAEKFLQTVRGDKMPAVEKDLIGRYLLADLHSDYA